MHEVHGPNLIDRLRHGQRFRLAAHQTLVRLNTQVQLQLAIDAVDALVVPDQPLDVAQVQKARTKAPVGPPVCQADQPIGDPLIVFAQLGPVAVAGLADAERLTGQANAQPLSRFIIETSMPPYLERHV